MISETKLRELFSNDETELIVKRKTVSTNTDAKYIAKNALSSPLLIVADSQSGGRGRQGKSFASPPGGLYMTLALPSGLEISKIVSVTSAASVIVCRSIEKLCSADCGIKWVNDIFISGKKLCGILVESINDYTNMKSNSVIIGIGINLTSHPHSVPSTSLFEEGFSLSPEILCHSITKELISYANKGFSFDEFFDEYKKRSVVLGREISYIKNGVCTDAVAESIDKQGGLIVRSGEKTETLSSGEITLKIKPAIG